MGGDSPDEPAFRGFRRESDEVPTRRARFSVPGLDPPDTWNPVRGTGHPIRLTGNWGAWSFGEGPGE